jgi:hypothetical protein
VAPDAKPERLNLVAANLRLGSLPDTDPALVELRQSVEQETGIPGALTDTLVHALRGADHLGSLLKVDKAVEAALDEHERTMPVRFKPQQQNLFEPNIPQQAEMSFEREHRPRHAARAPRGLPEQPHPRRRPRPAPARRAAGRRRALRADGAGGHLRPGGRPTRRTRARQAGRVQVRGAALRPRQGRPLRGVPAARARAGAPGGVSAMLTMRNWMFIKQYSGLREHLLGTYDLRALGDFDRGAFEEVPTSPERDRQRHFTARPSARKPALRSSRLHPTTAPTTESAPNEARRHPLPRGPPHLRPAALKVVPSGRWSTGGISFQGDVNRLPLFPVANADDIFATVERAFTEHESHREPSVEFRRPGPSPWRHAQAWAQIAVDRPEGAPLPAYVPEHDPEPATDHLSNALGVALGRFGARGRGHPRPGEKDSLAHALPAGILFLDGTLDAEDRPARQPRPPRSPPAARRL